MKFTLVDWIPVGERMPEKNVVVLVLAHNGRTPCTMRFNGENFVRSVSCRRCDGMSLSGITHWQPIGELPTICPECGNTTEKAGTLSRECLPF